MKYAIGDEVTVAHYTGVLNPDTIWLISKVSGKIVTLELKDKTPNDLTGFTRELMVGVDRIRPVDCRCMNIGEDDGGTTCWVCHDCSDGSCTHRE